MNQNTLEKIFRNGSDGKRRFTQVHQTGEKFSLFCKDILENPRCLNTTSIHTGFWIPKNWEIPLRLPVLIIPALEIIRWLLRESIQPPKLIIYQATSLISEVNGIPKEDAVTISQSMEKKLFQFIKDNFPEVMDYVVFSFWEKTQDTEIIEKIHWYTQKISDVLDVSTQSHFQNCEQQHSNQRGKYLLYLAANSYYNGSFQEYPFSEVWETEIIIPIWGRSEKTFFQVLLEGQTSCRKILPLITQVGAFSSYYRNPRWDAMTIHDIWKNFHPDIEKDLQVLSLYHI